MKRSDGRHCLPFLRFQPVGGLTTALSERGGASKAADLDHDGVSMSMRRISCVS